ncbi:MAG: hypothetical protein FWC40_07570 [Proteobacteria bacterium]|nr:hypothetical protein [Pseudomonadota bacterium]
MLMSFEYMVKRLLRSLPCLCFMMAMGGEAAFAQSDGLTSERWQGIATSQPVEAQDAESLRQSQTWLMPDIQTQILRDTQLNTVSKGGIFVASMTGGLNEPRYQVMDTEGSIVADAYTGSVTYVPEGDYVVAVGSPVAVERLEFDVTVVEGGVTIVPVEWSGLRVKVVDAQGSTIRASYEIVSLPERGYVGLGSGALLAEGERLSTWLLWPGKYMILSVGEGYQARKNFITVELKPGELSRVTLVIDEETGDILGGGEVDSIDDVPAESRWWSVGLLAGGSIRFSQNDNVIGRAVGKLLDLSVFAESFFMMNLAKNFLYARLNAEIGGTFRLDNRPFIPTVDNLSLEILYAYRLVEWFGPYARFSFESNMAPAYQEFNTPYTVHVYDFAQNIAKIENDKLDTRLSPSFSPITLNTGLGGRFDHAFGYWLKLNARLGVAYRYVMARDLYVVHDTDNTDRIVSLYPVTSRSQFGLEAALNIESTPIHWFTIKAGATVLEPFDDWRKPVYDVNLAAAIRLSSIASISYSLRLRYDYQMLDKLQLEQSVQLRFSYKFF